MGARDRASKPGVDGRKSSDQAAAALMHALRRQESWAIEELMRRYRPALLEVARRLRVPPEDQEGAVLSFMDDVVLRLMAGATPRSLDAYILRSFRNSAVLLPRRQRATQLALAVAHGERCGDAFLLRETSSAYAVQAALGDEIASGRQVLDALARHLATSMTEDERLLLEWRATGVPSAEVASWLGEHSGTVRVRLMRLRTRLARAANAYRDGLEEPDRSVVDRFLKHLSPAELAQRDASAPDPE